MVNIHPPQRMPREFCGTRRCNYISAVGEPNTVGGVPRRGFEAIEYSPELFLGERVLSSIFGYCRRVPGHPFDIPVLV